jgi:hypothetical protein
VTSKQQANWSPAANLPGGTYTVKTGVFSSDFNTSYGWNDNAASITVPQPVAPATSPTPAPAPPAPAAQAGTFYVDSAQGNDANSGTSPSQAWATLAKANQANLQPGQSLLFKRGGQWAGPLNIGWSGTATQPITVGAYGTGALPLINGSSTVMINLTGSYVTVDSIALSATPDHIDPGCTKYNPAGQTVGSRTGVLFGGNAQHDRFQNSDLTSLSVGLNIGLGANYNTITNNNFHDVNMMFTLTPQSVNNNDDAGAQNILISGDYTDISYNTFTGALACGYDYDGTNGQPMVMWGGQHNSIHHNYASGSGSNFIEEGANKGANRPADDNTLAYNVNIGTQFVTVHGPGDFWGPATNTKLYNNVTYTTGTGSITCRPCGTNILTMRNNIVWSDKSGTLDADVPFDEANDIFWNDAGNPYNPVPISSTSKLVNPMFVNPQAGDFHLQANSPALNTGSMQSVQAGYTTNRDGNTVGQNGTVNIGAY